MWSRLHWQKGVVDVSKIRACWCLAARAVSGCEGRSPSAPRGHSHCPECVRGLDRTHRTGPSGNWAERGRYRPWDGGGIYMLRELSTAPGHHV